MTFSTATPEQHSLERRWGWKYMFNSMAITRVVFCLQNTPQHLSALVKDSMRDTELSFPMVILVAYFKRSNNLAQDCSLYKVAYGRGLNIQKSR